MSGAGFLSCCFGIPVHYQWQHGHLFSHTIGCSPTHTPMYHFVSVLAFLELWYTITTILKMLANLLSDKKTISFSGYLLQTYFFHSLGASECYLLTAVACDRSLVICRPLHYPAIMTPTLCAKMSAGCWTCGFLCSNSEVILVSQFHFCGYSEIQHFFCNFPPLLNLACEDTSNNVLVDLPSMPSSSLSLSSLLWCLMEESLGLY